MTELKEKTGGKAKAGKPPKTVDCDWKVCKKTHAKKISYPNNGKIARSSTYRTAWVAAKLEPWEKHGNGIDSEATLTDYRAETPAAAYAVTAAALKYPEYHTQKHHLISVSLFKPVSKLSHNAKLIGYDVNHKNNGSCFPSYVADIVRHDLQCHRGGHPKLLYYDHIDPLLRAMEKRCIEYCEADLNCNTESQKDLIDDLNRLSTKCYGQIKAWKWLLRSNAIAERAQSKARYAALP